MKRYFVLLISLLMLLTSCAAAQEEEKRVMLFIGQDLGAIGGLEGYNEGYIDTFGMPDGVTTYTNLPSLSGLYTLDNWGSGDVCAQMYVNASTFDGVNMALGLHLVGHLAPTAKGVYQSSIKRLGEFIANSGRTVYLRIGYEFDGSWNAYDPDEYVLAFRKIVDTLHEMGVTNFQTVWQSSGNGTAQHLLQWYPGDDYVDWMGYSYFTGSGTVIGKGILQLAREHGKPVFIAESTPKSNLSAGNGRLLWMLWYEPFLKHIETNSDVIGAISYINCNWNEQPMWKGQGWGDSRIQVNEEITAKWLEVLNNGVFSK